MLSHIKINNDNRLNDGFFMIWFGKVATK